MLLSQNRKLSLVFTVEAFIVVGDDRCETMGG